MRKYCAILYKGLEHLQILEMGDGRWFWNQFPSGTKR